MTIPIKTRANYVAYLRLCVVIEQLEHIPKGANKPEGADDILATLKKWCRGLERKLKPFLESTDTDEDDGG